jgi:hypothetical protein
MARVSVEVPAELVRQVRETVLLLYQATAESLHQALKARGEGQPARGDCEAARGEDEAAHGDDDVARRDDEAALDEAHLHRLRVDELDDLARSLGGEPRDIGVSAPRDLLHDMLYGALIDAGERLAEISNRSWRGELPLERVRESAEEVLALDALLRGLDR